KSDRRNRPTALQAAPISALTCGYTPLCRTSPAIRRAIRAADADPARRASDTSTNHSRGRPLTRQAGEAVSDSRADALVAIVTDATRCPVLPPGCPATGRDRVLLALVKGAAPGGGMPAGALSLERSRA